MDWMFALAGGLTLTLTAVVNFMLTGSGSVTKP